MLVSNSLHAYLFIAISLFVIGVYGMIQHRSFVGMLISVELVLNGAALNFMAFNKFLVPDTVTGQVFIIFIMGIAAAETIIVVSLILVVYRKFFTQDPDDLNNLKH